MAKVSLLITTYNRVDYLQQCLKSLGNADLSKIDNVLIFDDCSTDVEVGRVCLEFIQDRPNWTFVKEMRNKGIKNSLLVGCNILFNQSDLVINLDADALVSKNFVTRILGVKEKYPELLVTGFNCNTLNRDGSVRHKVLFKEDKVNFKKSVGGINMCFNKKQYHKWIKPSLEELNTNWDCETCLRSASESLPIACVEPSVVQHIGYNSSLGHDAGGEPPDVANDFVEYSIDDWYTEALLNAYKEYEKARLILPQVTLIGIDCLDINRLLKVADKACDQISFGDVKMLSSLPSDDSRVVKIRHISSKEDYSWFVMKELIDYIGTSHFLIIQHDGQVHNPQAWRNEWLEYDYIGAKWAFGDQAHPVGNGGLSLRTRKFQQAVANDEAIIPMNQPGVNFHKEEDHVCCRIFGDYLIERYGIKFAPVEEAEMFSIEAWENPDPVYRGQFGFHGGGIKF